MLEGMAQPFSLAFGRETAKRDRKRAALVGSNRRTRDDVQRTDGPCDEIGWERQRRHEADPLKAVGELERAFDRGVRRCKLIRGNGEGHFERGFESRLVEAGERKARADRLELGERVSVPGRLDAIEPSQRRVEPCRVLHVQGTPARGQGLLEIDADDAVRGLLCPGRWDASGGVSRVDRSDV